jgi:hypothetical protein
MDANESRIDHIELNQIQFFDRQGDRGNSASYILGSNPPHKLRDCYRIWLEKNTEEYKWIENEQREKSDKELETIPPCSVPYYPWCKVEEV